MGPVAVVTDSTSGLPPSLAERQGVTVVPCWVFFDGRQLRDGLDLSASELYARMLADPGLLVATSTPSLGEMLAAYDRLLAAGHGIVSVHISHRLSTIVNVARDAARQRPGRTIEVVDSGTASMACGFAALAAAQSAARGRPAREVAQAAATIARRSRLYGMLETLRYVQHSGRLMAAGARTAEALRLRPLIDIHDGRVRLLRMERTRERGLRRLLELVADRSDGHRLHAAVIHSAAAGEAAELAEELAGRRRCVELLTSEFSPVAGGHTGPGFIGIAFYPESARRKG